MRKISIGKHKYALVFCLVCMTMFTLIYWPVLFGGKMYMYLDIGADTYCSYWPSLSYCADLLKDVRLWDMNLGLGSSTLIQIAYFMLDPFNWIVFLFSPYNMDTGIVIGLCLKNIVLGRFAFMYIGKMNIKGWPQILSAISIVFSGWFIGWGQHYNYATMFVFFIIILYFFEHWLQDGKWVGFVLSLAWLAMITVYYTYMVLLFLALYYIVRRLSRYSISEYKLLLKHGIKTTGLCLVGLGTAAVIFFPTAVDLLNSPRVQAKLVPDLSLASFQEYLTVALRIFSNNILGINRYFYGYSNWYESPFMYVGIILLFLIPLLYTKKRRTKLSVSILVMVAFSIVFLNSVSIIFNAFSTITYRWTFVLVPVMALGIGAAAKEFENGGVEIGKISRVVYSVINFVIISYCIYLMKIRTEYIHNAIAYSTGIIFICATAYFMILNRKWKSRQAALACLVMVSVLELSSNGVISVQCRSIIDKTDKSSMNYFDDSNELVQHIDGIDNGIYRINKKYAYSDLNDSMIQHYNGEKYYSSILNDSYRNLQEMFDLRVKNSNYFYGFDDKQFLRDINAGKYMITAAAKDYYGFEQIYHSGERYLYKNLNNLGFGFLYDNYITRSAFNNLSQLEQQNIVYSACIIDDEDESSIDDTVSLIEKGPQVSLEKVVCDSAIEESGMELLLAGNSSKCLTLKITNTSDGSINTAMYAAPLEEEYRTEDYTAINVATGETKYYNINELNVGKIRLDIPVGILKIEVYEKDMLELEEIIAQKQKNTMQIRVWDDEYIEGTIESNEKALLYLPIIYDNNWKIYINGEEKSIVRANGGFCSVSIGPGRNSVIISYNSGIFRYGMIISICTLMGLCAIYCGKKIFKRKRKQNAVY